MAAALAIRHGHLDALLEQQIHLTTRLFEQHGRTVAGQFIHGDRDGLGRQRGIQSLQSRAQPGHQHYFALRLALQRAGRAEGFLKRRHRRPTKLCE
ncbi:MAG: hypothetical protein WBL40_15150 [Terrimicrobiaceae bacterium]